MRSVGRAAVRAVVAGSQPNKMGPRIAVATARTIIPTPVRKRKAAMFKANLIKGHSYG